MDDGIASSAILRTVAHVVANVPRLSSAVRRAPSTGPNPDPFPGECAPNRLPEEMGRRRAVMNAELLAQFHQRRAWRIVVLGNGVLGRW